MTPNLTTWTESELRDAIRRNAYHGWQCVCEHCGVEFAETKHAVCTPCCEAELLRRKETTG